MSEKPKCGKSNEPKKLGRPLKYKTAEELEAAINEYFTDCDVREVPYTIPGMAYALGFSDRHALLHYAGRDVFCATIKKARSRIERQRVENLIAGRGSTPGQIFDLKNNFGYLDKIDTEIYGKDGGPVVIKVARKSEK